MMTNKGICVITGASAGLGEAFARRLWREGFSLLLIARRKERLKALCEELLLTGKKRQTCEFLSLDLSDLSACEQVMEYIKDKEVRLFINNAGFGTCGCFTDTDLSKELAMVDLNIKTLHFFTKRMISFYEERGMKGAILNVASSAGLIPAGPYMAAYYAGKSYAASLTRAVACELKNKKSGIYLGCLCPGPVDTEFNAHADVKTPLKGMTAEKCVDIALKGMKKRKTVILPGLSIKLLSIFGRFMPESLYITMVGRQQHRKLGR